MKNKIIQFGIALVCIAGFAATGTAQTLTLDLQGHPKDTLPGGYWTQTYNEDSTFIKFGEFIFSHSSGFGGTYWDGFTYATNGDSARYGIPCPIPPCDTTHSVPWVSKQWGVMAGGGIKTISGDEVIAVEKGIPYLVAYWSSYHEGIGHHSLEVILEDSALFAPQEIYISNHPWPYWGNIYGDGFARPLDQNGDEFKLIIHAIYDDNSEDSMEWTLAEYDGSELEQEHTWQHLDISDLGNDVKALYFTMESTDSSPYGPNTATYFCLDKLKVTKQTSLKSSVTQKAKEKPAKPVYSFTEVTNEIPLSSYTGGTVSFYNTLEKEVLRTEVRAGENNIDLSALPAGEYLLVHGQKIIPVKKVN